MENPFEILDLRLKRIESLLEQIVGQNEIVGDSNNFQIMTIEQVSDYINLAVPTIYGKVHSRTIPYYKRGKRLYFNKKEINDWLVEGKQPTKEDLNRKADEYLLRNPL